MAQSALISTPLRFGQKMVTGYLSRKQKIKEHMAFRQAVDVSIKFLYPEGKRLPFAYIPLYTSEIKTTERPDRGVFDPWMTIPCGEFRVREIQLKPFTGLQRTDFRTLSSFLPLFKHI